MASASLNCANERKRAAVGEFELQIAGPMIAMRCCQEPAHYNAALSELPPGQHRAEPMATSEVARGLWPDESGKAPSTPVLEDRTLGRDEAHTIFSSSRTQPAGGEYTAVGATRYQADLERTILRDALCSSSCLWQLLLTALASIGVHLLVGWGVLTNWNDHQPIPICLFAWAHPAGYSGAGTSIAQAIPVDAFLVAFIVCLFSMKRVGDVQRGLLPHVPSAVLHRGPLFVLFPRGTEVFPKVSSLLLVTFVWTILWTALMLGALSIAYAAGGDRSLCISGWTYTVARGAWGTLEALLVSAGSFLLWCSKGEDHHSRSLVERARMRREADEQDARRAANFFGWFQVFVLLVSLVALGFAVWTWYFAYGGLPASVWVGTIACVLCSLVLWLTGALLSRYHTRDETHAAKVHARGPSPLPAHLTAT